MRMKELNKDDNLSIIGGYYPPSEEPVSYTHLRAHETRV